MRWHLAPSTCTCAQGNYPRYTRFNLPTFRCPPILIFPLLANKQDASTNILNLRLSYFNQAQRPSCTKHRHAPTEEIKTYLAFELILLRRQNTRNVIRRHDARSNPASQSQSVSLDDTKEANRGAAADERR